MHVITGLPRSGSTLLCNILAQNPEYKIQHTSPLASLLSNLSLTASISPDMQNAYVENQAMYRRLVEASRAFAEGWNGFEPEPPKRKRGAKKEAPKTVWDKSRLWCVNAMLLRELYPDSKMIVMVRDLRDVAASLEKQHRKQPMFDAATTMQEKTMWTRTEQYMAPNDLIGSSVIGVEDLMRRQFPNVIVIAYEELVYNPAKCLGAIDDFEYDFENIVNTATDVDAINLDKYPHTGEGAVDKSHVGEWKDFISPDLADQIRNWYPFYTKGLGY